MAKIPGLKDAKIQKITNPEKISVFEKIPNHRDKNFETVRKDCFFETVLSPDQKIPNPGNENPKTLLTRNHGDFGPRISGYKKP